MQNAVLICFVWTKISFDLFCFVQKLVLIVFVKNCFCFKYFVLFCQSVFFVSFCILCCFVQNNDLFLINIT